MTQEDEIEKLQIELYQDPTSGQFVRLAELYLSKEMPSEAADLVKQSLKFHPQSISGHLLLGRSLRKLGQQQEAINALIRATQLATDNWRAWLELAECYLELRLAKKAQEAYKKVLFLNPTHPTARRAVAKLEVLTAEDYEDDLFQMQKLPDAELEEEVTAVPEQQWSEPPEALSRVLSYIDALILRNENRKALDLLNDCSVKYGAHPEVETRRLKLSVYEKPDFIKPKSLADASKSRREIVLDRKVKALEELLRRIESFKSQSLSTSL